jgi:cold-inducible RNA-binding protein
MVGHTTPHSLNVSPHVTTTLSRIWDRDLAANGNDFGRGTNSTALLPIPAARWVVWFLDEPQSRIELSIMSNRLYVGNLSFNCGEETLRSTFAKFGDVTDVHLVSDRTTGQSRGFGFVTMGSSDAAVTAMQELNGATLDGRSLRVNEAEERSSTGRSGGGRQGQRNAGGRW